MFRCPNTSPRNHSALMRETPVSETTPAPAVDTPVSEPRNTAPDAASGGSDSNDNSSPRADGEGGGEAGEGGGGQRMSRREIGRAHV